MKRKDYELISKVISGLRGKVKVTDCPVKVLVWSHFSTAFDRENANFDADKFKATCHVD